MALPPTIPTSFIPHAVASSVPRARANLVGVFGLFSYAILGIVFALALMVFLYGRILASSMASKNAALETAQTAIDPATVESFVQLRDRLTSSETLLDEHIAFSNFFTLLGNILPANVRFTALHLSHSDVGGVKISGTGIAKNFNVLAAASNAFATDGRIRDAIFSNISINPSGSVSFALSASIDSKLVAFMPAAPVVAEPAVTLPSTAATSSAPLP
ncbi:MAG: hypothetical protein WA058_00060 [Minisyncoccia bacterium]